MEFYNTYTNLETGKRVSMDDAIKFVEYVAKIFNPSAAYNKEITISAFRNGFGGYILQTCQEVVRKNPDKFHIQRTDVISKSGTLLNTYFKTF